MVGKWTLLSCTVFFLFRQSNLGVPGVWAFHIGSTSPLDNIRPATVGGDLTKAHPSPPLEQSFGPTAAAERDYTEDNLDYYDENEGEVEYPPGEPEDAWNGHSSIDVSFQSKAEPRPLGGPASPLPQLTASDQPLYPEAESATLDPQTKEGRALGGVDTPGLNGRVKASRQQGTRGPAPSEIEGDSLDPTRGAPPPYADGGAPPSEEGAPSAHPEGKAVLLNYPVPAHTPPLGRGRQVLGVEDVIGSSTEGKCRRSLGAGISFLKCWFAQSCSFSLKRVGVTFSKRKIGTDFLNLCFRRWSIFPLPNKSWQANSIGIS